jgi:hypothetical protein
MVFLFSAIVPVTMNDSWMVVIEMSGLCLGSSWLKFWVPVGSNVLQLVHVIWLKCAMSGFQLALRYKRSRTW